MSAQAISTQPTYFQYKSLLETNRTNGLFQDMELPRSILAKNVGNRNSNILLSKQSWSQVDLNDMSNYSKQFARETWICSVCGYENYEGIKGCGYCSSPRY